MRISLSKIFYLCFIAILLIAWFKTKELPPENTVVEEMAQEPVQAQGTEREEFDFDYRGATYHVRPLAEYELWGLVVTQNDINKWYNIYHDKDTVNLRDVCVVWGENVTDGAYRDKEIHFSSGEWTCRYEWSGRMEKKFYKDKLSNNHLLAADKSIQNTIRSINVGDQIYLKGSLVDYAQKGNDWYRMTSLSREDSNSESRSGGACEIFFVDDIKILGRNNLAWNEVNKWGWKALLTIAFLNVLYFLYKTNRVFKSKKL